MDSNMNNSSISGAGTNNLSAGCKAQIVRSSCLSYKRVVNIVGYAKWRVTHTNLLYTGSLLHILSSLFFCNS